MSDIGTTVGLIKAVAPKPTAEDITTAVDAWLDDHPEATTTVQDGSITKAKLDASLQGTVDDVGDLKSEISDINTATSGAIGKALSPKTVSGGKVTKWQFKSIGGGTSADLYYVTPEEYGAVGDGVTDDSQAVQDACDAGYAVYFASGKTYYLASAVTIDHDCHLFGGENTVIKTARPSGGTVNEAFVVTGTLKKTTTLTSNYTNNGDSTGTDNVSNRFTLSDMTGINVGDVMVITATDQYYSLTRDYYYLGGTLLITDVYNGHIYTCDNMPFDIENTANVSVKIYDAPTAIIENLNFVSDYSGVGSFNYFVQLKRCKNSIVRNCDMTQMDNGLCIYESVNTLVDCLSLSNSKYDNTLSPDAYGIGIYSSTNSIVKRVMAICAQHCITISGTIPSLNTRILDSNLLSECRSNGLNCHDCNYNLLVEDCVLGGMLLSGTAIVNRCKFIQNYRAPQSTFLGVALYGSHNAMYSNYTITDCDFEGGQGQYLSITIQSAAVQDPIRASDYIIGNIVVKNCSGFTVIYNPTISADVLSSTVKNISITESSLYEIYHTSNGLIDNMEVIDCVFAAEKWFSNHTDAFYYDYITNLLVKCNNPLTETKVARRKKMSQEYYLNTGYDISLSASSQDVHYTVCGKNVASNDPDDYDGGSCSSTVGNTFSRTHQDLMNGALSTNSDGNIVLTYPDTSQTKFIWLKGYLFTNTPGTIKMSCTLKNTGNTNAATFRLYAIVIDPVTGKVTKRNVSSDVTATPAGATATITAPYMSWDQSNQYSIVNKMIQFAIFCPSAVANSETTFENMTFEVDSLINGDSIRYTKYVGSCRDGDGILKTVEGINNVMASQAVFNTSFNVDMLN